MTLTNNHLRDVCLLHHADSTKTCRYLHEDELEDDKWYCCKLLSYAKDRVDKRIEVTKGGKIPMGDNCGGYPILRHLEQGYDVTS